MIRLWMRRDILDMVGLRELGLGLAWSNFHTYCEMPMKVLVECKVIK